MSKVALVQLERLVDVPRGGEVQRGSDGGASGEHGGLDVAVAVGGHWRGGGERFKFFLYVWEKRVVDSSTWIPRLDLKVHFTLPEVVSNGRWGPMWCHCGMIAANGPERRRTPGGPADSQKKAVDA